MPDRVHAEPEAATPDTVRAAGDRAAITLAGTVLALQRTAGNAAVARLVRERALQRAPGGPGGLADLDPGIVPQDVPWNQGGDVEELQAKPGTDAPATPAARQAIETAGGITLRDGDKAWSQYDLIDLGAALATLNAADRPAVVGSVIHRFSTEAAKAAVLGGASAAASAQTFVRSATDRVIAIWDIAFDHPKSSGGIRFTGKTVHGVNQGVYAFVHEFGHLIEIPRQAMIATYAPVEKADRAAKGDVSTQPQAKNTDVRERFAEAYARFKVDSTELKTEHPGIHGFFAAGKHMAGTVAFP